jgi:hypothetical protein
MNDTANLSQRSVVEESSEELAFQPRLKRVRRLPEKYFPYARKPFGENYIDHYGRNVEPGRPGHCGSCQRNFSSVKEVKGKYLCEFCDPLETEQPVA